MAVLTRKEYNELVEQAKKLEGIIAETKAADPFYWFEPSRGDVTEEGWRILRKYLKPEDLPSGVLDSQLDALCSLSPIKGVSGGNQSGKSTTGAIKAYITATGELPVSLEQIYPKDLMPKGPKAIRVVGVSNKQLFNTVLPTYKYWCPKKYLKNGKWEDSFSSLHNTLTLTNGSFIEFMTNEMDVDVFQGPPRDLVIYDEEPREDIHKENLMRFTTSDRIDFLFCWTPTHGITWATSLFTDGIDGKGNEAKLFKLCSVSNPRANLEVLDAILSNLGDYNEIKMRLLGEFVSLSGLVYGRLFNDKIHVIEPFKLDKYNHFVVRGIDPHLVKPSAALELAVDREGNEYVIGCYLKDADTDQLKADLADRAKGYRLGWSIFDKSSDSTIKVFGDRNVFIEMTRGKNAVPGAFKSDKFTGSINAGVDEIKKLLKLGEKTKKPKLFIFNIPENKPLIQAMKFLERDSYPNEDDKGKRDKIKEGKWDLHACLRYIHQRNVRWIPPEEKVPGYQEERYI